MAKPLYKKIVQGFCEQVYDEAGNCVSQEFLTYDEEPVERRYIRLEDEENDGLEDDELIEHPEDLKMLVEREKFFPYEMSQPAAGKLTKEKIHAEIRGVQPSPKAG